MNTRDFSIRVKATCPDCNGVQEVVVGVHTKDGSIPEQFIACANCDKKFAIRGFLEPIIQTSELSFS